MRPVCRPSARSQSTPLPGALGPSARYAAGVKSALRRVLTRSLPQAAETGFRARS